MIRAIDFYSRVIPGLIREPVKKEIHLCWIPNQVGNDRIGRLV